MQMYEKIQENKKKRKVLTQTWKLLYTRSPFALAKGLLDALSKCL